MKKTKLILSIIFMVIGISLLSYTLINHLLELNDMKECAQTPGCMYCLPKWAGPTSYFLYFISSILILISIINFILFIKHKRSKIS